MLRLLICCLCLLYTLPSCVEVATASPQLVSAIPALRIIDAASSANNTGTALQIAKLKIDIAVTGNIATTTFDITFYNPADKILEGEFNFPLADGQNISRYALDMNGILREGVVVEKAVARVAFEKTIRRKIDPGLVEKTGGNNFRTRIYPIPAKGYKRVVIGTEQPLSFAKEGLLYKLPLYGAQPLQEFSITATIHKGTEEPMLQDNSLHGFEFNKTAADWTASYQANNFTVEHLIQFIIPVKKDMAYTEKFDGKTYFYVHTQAEPQYQKKPKPASITLLWDISASGENRNRIKEIELLKGYFNRLEEVTVNLVPFNIAALPAEQFIIKNGDASTLLHQINLLRYDGGTQLGTINLNQYSTNEILLFTDGMSTFGKKEMAIGQIPVTVITTAAGADFSYLKWIALQSHGRFINLAETATEDALNEMEKSPLQFINATYNNSEVTELFTQTTASLQNGFSFAGLLQKSTASVTLNFGYGNTITSSKTILITADNTATGNIKRIWATTKIAQLDLEYEKNKAMITSLGKQFSIVTQNTSLLVLDRVEDYVQYDIVPPAELQNEYYYSLIKEKQQTKTNEKETAMQQAITAMDEMKSWYNQKQLFRLNKKQSADNVVITETGTANGSITGYNYSGRDSTTVNMINAAIRPQQDAVVKFTPPLIVRDEEVKEDEKAPAQERLDNANIGTINQEGAKDEDVAAPPVERGTGTVNGYKDVQSGNVGLLNTDKTATPKIQLTEWTADAVYLKELENTPALNQYDKYLLIKKSYLSQPSFFIDVSRFFFAKNNKALALQVLSNIAEMKLEDPELLRMVANQLLEFGEPALAAEVFTAVLNIREEEPQSCRDLALAYNETGNYQQAVDLLYKIVISNWDERFYSIKGIALNEMNAIISSHPAAVNVSAIGKQFIQPMPVDVRIVIGWSSNNSDVDLWVTDPNEEKCYYQNNTTHGGGKISGDITQGYGPEEFCVRKAANGNYQVDVNLYGDSRQTLGGPITIKAELFTDFGKPTQRRKLINCRVTSNKEVIRIGALHFGK